jgi:hypothetical protein
MSLETNSKHQPDACEDRRKFLATCGKFAIVTPPAITLLLSTSLHSQAIAMSGGKGSDYGHRDYDHRNYDHRNNGYGNGGGDNSPNGKEDDDR